MSSVLIDKVINAILGFIQFQFWHWGAVVCQLQVRKEVVEEFEKA